MYNLPQYKEENPEAVLAFMKAHPFAMLIGVRGNRPEATQAPLLFRESGERLTLLGHLMRKQDHTLAFEENGQVLVIFTGPHSYVSGTWYSQPSQASTWNYISVHVRGRLRFLDEQGLSAALQELTLKYENGDTGSSTVFSNLPVAYRERLMKSIVGFEIEVESIENVFKLSQNRDEASYANIMPKLQQQGGDAEKIAAMMRERHSQLFKDDYKAG